MKWKCHQWKNLENDISLSGQNLEESSEKSWKENIFKWCKNHDVDSSNDYCILGFGLVKEYNTQVYFGAWSVDVDLLNHVKNKFANSLPYFFTLSTLIILLVIVFI